MSIDGLLTIRSSRAIAHPHNPPKLDVRTAYQEWFNDLYKSTPPKLPAVSRRKKSFESAEVDEILKLRTQPRKKRFSKKCMEHAMAPTSSSLRRDTNGPRVPSNNEVEVYLTVTDAMRAAHQQAANRRFQALLDEADCASYTYESPFFPETRFFQALVDHLLSSNPCMTEFPSIGVDIPPTLIRLRNNAGAVFIHKRNCTADDNTLALIHLKSREEMLTKTNDILQSFSVHAAQNPIAIAKSTDRAARKRSWTLQSLEEVKASMQMLWDFNSVGHIMIQKFIVCKRQTGIQMETIDQTKESSHKRYENKWFARPVYRSKEKSTFVWIIRNTGSKGNDSADSSNCQIVKCTSRNAWLQPRRIVETVGPRLEALLSLSFASLSLDLIQDTEGKWWHLQVKAFQLDSKTGFKHSLTRTNSTPERVFSSLNHCDGKFCQEPAPNEQNAMLYVSFPSRQLVRKDLISCHYFQDYYMHQTNDTSDFSAALDWFLRTKVSKKDRCRLYEVVVLCKNCIEKYFSLQQQLVSAVNVDGQQRSKSRSQAPRKSNDRVYRSSKEIATILPALSSRQSPALNHKDSGDLELSLDEDIVHPHCRAEIENLVKRADDTFMSIGSRLQTLTLGPTLSRQVGIEHSWPKHLKSLDNHKEGGPHD